MKQPTPHRHLSGVILTVVTTLVAALFGAAPAQARDMREVPQLTTDVTIKEQTYSADWSTLLSTQVYHPEGTTFQARSTDSGSGGTSTLAGCRRVTVINVKNTLFGNTAFRYTTWTDWCWERYNDRVFDVSVDWKFAEVDGAYVWKGQVRKETGFYDYGVNDNNPRSAYKHLRVGEFWNCVPLLGCPWQTSYPSNTIRSYYNGTWAWSTDD